MIRLGRNSAGRLLFMVASFPDHLNRSGTLVVTAGGAVTTREHAISTTEEYLQLNVEQQLPLDQHLLYAS